MARSDWDIKGIIVYTANEFKDDPWYGMEMDIYEYSFWDGNYIPIKIIKKLLRVSEQKFVDILNEDITSKKHLITNYEEQFRLELNNTYGYKNLFTKEQVFGGISDLSVELADFEDWLDDNYELLKENRATQKENYCLPDIDAMQSRIAELEAENTKLRERVTELENKALQAGKAPRLRAMWKYILDLEERGISDSAIREALKKDGFSYATADALLYDGDGKTIDAVKKWKIRKGEDGDI